MRSGIPPFSRWLCLRLRSILKHLGFVFVSAWAWFVSTLPRTLRSCCRCFFCLVICWQVSGISPVSAQFYPPTIPYIATSTGTPGPTSTPVPPTATFRPLFPSTTPLPTDFYECSGTQPAGYGVVTPGPGWLWNCGKCITPVSNYPWATTNPEPTFTWEDFFDATAAPAVTITPNAPAVTSTPATSGFKAQSINQGQYPNIVTNLSEGVAQTVAWTYSYVLDGGNLGGVNGPYPQTMGISMSGHVKFTTDSTYCGSAVWFEIASTDGYTTPNGYDWEVVESDIMGLPAGTSDNYINGEDRLFKILDGGCGSVYEKDFNVKINVTFRNDNMYYNGWPVKLAILANYYLTTKEGTTTTTFYNGPVPLTPIPEPPNDCDNIASAPGDEAGYGAGSYGNDYFALPVFGVGQSSCFAFGGNFIPLAWAQAFYSGSPDDALLPSVQVCLAPITFGNLVIFNKTIELDTWAAVLGVVALIRIVTRS